MLTATANQRTTATASAHALRVRLASEARFGGLRETVRALNPAFGRKALPIVALEGERTALFGPAVAAAGAARPTDARIAFAQPESVKGKPAQGIDAQVVGLGMGSNGANATFEAYPGGGTRRAGAG